jgi:hypothetical protein
MTPTKNSPKKAALQAGSIKAQRRQFRSREERLAAGKALRDDLPRESHA